MEHNVGTVTEEEGKKTILTPDERAEFEEFKRVQRRKEIALRLTKLVADGSRREIDRAALGKLCALAIRLHMGSVLVSPVNVSAAKRFLGGRADVVCLTGGTGESLPSVKKTEAKRAAAQGAREIRMELCYSALAGGNFGYLKREIKKVRRAVKKCPLTVSLTDRMLTEEQVALGTRAAREAKADGVCVRGELPLLQAALKAGGGIRVDVSGVENAGQFNSLLRAGALRAVSPCAKTVAEQLLLSAENAGS